MTRLELAELGKRVRDAQREYLKTSSHEALAQSKQIESEFDAAIKQIIIEDIIEPLYGKRQLYQQVKRGE